jgi:hypothetical protein
MEPHSPAEWFVVLAGSVSLMDMLVRLGILVAVVYVLIQQADIRRRLTLLEVKAKPEVPVAVFPQRSLRHDYSGSGAGEF